MAAAAAEAPRSSSSGSADSYIGSLISLTSKSEIRYEGVLFNINTEESSIGLRNVRSFGTEGRRKEGLQVPPSDKIYEYILFRGSDIKDLQVKSSPPVQPTTSIHNDPAIIQSHYSQAASTSLPSGTGSLPDPTSQTAQLGLSRPNFHGNPSLYQPGRSLGPWGSSPVPTTNGVGLPMPLYWQGFYGSSNGLQGQQQALLQPAHGLPMLPSLQQPMQYPAMNASLSTGSSNLAASHLSEHRPPLMPPISTGTFNFLSPTPPATISDTSTNLIPDKASAQTLPTAASKTSLPLVPSLNTGVDDTVAAAVSEPKPIPGSLMPFQSLSESTSAIGMSSSILNDGKMPSLVTPDQLLHPGLPTVSSLQSPQTAQKDVEVVQLSSSESPPPPQASSIDVQEPLLPLPSTTERKPYGRATTYTQYGYRGGRGRGRGRGNEISRSATKFTEDFDFSAMNEKFNKDEVWGHLGKSNKAQEDGDNYEDEEDVGSSKHETKPVYVKDDFFDSLSCDALGGGSRNGRPRFSEQVRRDTETFGDFPRYSGGRGGRGPYRGGRARGSYHGRGYGYAPRGRGYGMSGAS